MATNIRAWVEPPLFDKTGKRIKYAEEQVFRIRYRDKNYKKVTAEKITGSKNAELMQAKVQKNLDSGRLGIANAMHPAKEVFEKFMAEYELEHEENSVSTMRGDLKPLLSRQSVVTMNDIIPDELKKYKQDMYNGLGFTKPLAKGTIYRYLASAKTWLKWCRSNNFIDWNPFENVTNPQPKSTARFLTDNEIEACEAISSDRFRPLFRLGWLAGLRQGEMFEMRAEDLTRLPNGAGNILLRDTKNGRDRVVPLEPEVMEIIPKKESGPLFPGWNYTVLKREWGKAKKVANITGKCPFHATRHTFAKKYMEKGGQETVLQKILGHTSLQMISKVYGHFAPITLARSMESISDGIKLPRAFGVVQ